MEKKRVRVIISGKVQGVFFRAETERAAKKRGINGWVRNRRDGSVEAVFEGDSEAVGDMIQWCRKGPPLAFVDRVQQFEESYEDEFMEFTIQSTV